MHHTYGDAAALGPAEGSGPSSLPTPSGSCRGVVGAGWLQPAGDQQGSSVSPLEQAGRAGVCHLVIPEAEEALCFQGEML